MDRGEGGESRGWLVGWFEWVGERVNGGKDE